MYQVTTYKIIFIIAFELTLSYWGFTGWAIVVDHPGNLFPLACPRLIGTFSVFEAMMNQVPETYSEHKRNLLNFFIIVSTKSSKIDCNKLKFAWNDIAINLIDQYKQRH